MEIYKLYYSNIQNPTLLDIITYKCLQRGFNKIAYYIDKFRYKNVKTKKLITQYNADNYVKDVDNIYKHISYVYKTKAFNVYQLTLQNGLYLKCADTHRVMTLNGWKYVKDLTYNDYVSTINGYSKVQNIFILNKKEYMYDITVDTDEHSYITNGIQSHQTTSTVAYLIWFMLFHADRNLLITANKEKTTKEILQKLKEALKGLPFFLKPGIEEVSKVALRLENGSNIRAVATTGDSATGDSINILIIDEAALIPQNVLTEFWASVFPTMSSFKQSQIIVMSTPRGRSGLYYDLYSGALNGTNGFVHKRVDWWQVPGHDEKWKEDQIAVFGQALWDREFALSFDTNESRLIPPEDFQFIERIKKNYTSVNIYGVPKRVSEKILWDPTFNPDQLTEYDLMKRRFVCICDLAEGKEKGEYGKEDADYNVINIFEIQLMSPSRIMKNRLGYKAVKQKNVIRLVQRGVYIDNNKDEEECAQALQHIAFDIFKNGQGEIDNMKILYERNFNGKNFIKVFSKHDMYYESIIKGFTTTGGEHGKKYFCELTQKMIALRQIIINQDNSVPVMSTIEQLKTFGKVKNSYAGLSAHDDLAITVMWCSRFFEDEEYFEWLDDWMSILPTFDYHENPSELIMIQKVLEMLQIYEVNMDDEMADDDGMLRHAASGFGQLNHQINGTYGSLMSGNNSSNNFGNYNQGYNNFGNGLSTYSSLINNPVTRTKYK